MRRRPSTAEQQLTDIDSLIAQGADVLIILAKDATAIGPAVKAAKAKASRSSRTTA